MRPLNLATTTGMTDVFKPKKRSQIMSRITSKDTSPEMAVRKTLHKMGYRYSLHVPSLPGKPDIVLKKHQTAIFVNGCFWHQHRGCKRLAMPKANIKYWKPKLKKNIEKQKEDTKQLKKEGWKVHVIWECGTKNEERLTKRLRKIL